MKKDVCFPSSRICRKATLRLAIDCVGGQSTNRLGQCLSENGLVVNYGMLSLEPCVFHTEHLIFRNVQLLGFWLSRILNKMSAVDRSQQIAQLATWTCEGKLHGPYRFDFLDSRN